MKLYVVMIEDRHTDPDCEIFSAAEDAIAYARETAKESCSHPEDSDEYEEEVVEGWLFCARYSTEGDSVWVVEKTVDEEK